MPEDYQGRILSLQLLRMLAAAIVAIAHLAFAFSDKVGEGLGLGWLGYDGQAPQAAVALFFLISGYVMVLSSRPLFAQPAGTQKFWLRRCIRILPPYWIATLLLAGLMLWQSSGVEPGYLLRSLALLPGEDAEGVRQLPLLWPGWTLFYEMLFYLAFGAGVSFGRRQAVVLAAAAIMVLVIAGLLVEQPGPIMFSLSRPISLLFVLGMALALWRERGSALHAILRWALGIAALLAYIVVPSPVDADLLDAAWLLWAGLPALLLFVAVAGGPLALPFPRLCDLLGGASYALYLLHLPVAWLWLIAYPGFLFRFGPWLHLVTLLIASFVAAFAFYLWVERPLTRWLNARLLPCRG